MNQILACWLGSNQISSKAGCCCPGQTCLFKNNRSSWPEFDCCFTCSAYGKAKAFSCSFFLCEKCHDIRYGCSYSGKSRARRQKARPENGYLRKQQLKGFQQWKCLRTKDINLACTNLVVVLYDRFCIVSSSRYLATFKTPFSHFPYANQASGPLWTCLMASPNLCMAWYCSRSDSVWPRNWSLMESWSWGW